MKAITEKFLRDLPVINWSDFDSAAQISQEILSQLAEDRNKVVLKDLLYNARYSETLLPMCECHSLDDKIVIYDGLKEKGFRIRFRLSTNDQYERIHNHRFSATHCILRGRYYQKVYSNSKPLNNQSKPEDFKVIWVRDDGAGNTFTIHHNTLHTTITEANTVSLILRGTTEKENAFVFNRDSAQMRWKEGIEKESVERRASVDMPIAVFDQWCDKLDQMKII